MALLFLSLKSEIWRCLHRNQKKKIELSVQPKAQLNSRCYYLVLREATEGIMAETACCNGLLKLGIGASAAELQLCSTGEERYPQSLLLQASTILLSVSVWCERRGA